MNNHTNPLLSLSKAKYYKFRSRLEKSLARGEFHHLPQRRKNGLVAQLKKLGARIENLGLAKGTMVAGSVAAVSAISSDANAQIDPNFYLQQSSIELTQFSSASIDVVIGDIDEDDELEIITSSNFGGRIFNRRNDSDFSYSDPSSLSNAQGQMFLGDIDGDNDLDLVFLDYGDGTYIYTGRNDGSGDFTDTFIFSTSGISDIDLVDFDSDGDLDILFATNNGTGINVLANNGAGIFSSETAITPGGDNVEDFEFADMDNDGDRDLVYANRNGVTPDFGRVYALENTRDGVGTPILNAGSSTELMSANYNDLRNVTVLDFDGDGDLDVFAHKYDYQYASSNNHVEGNSFDFDPISVPFFNYRNENIRDVAVADFDNDGDDDLIITQEGLSALDGYTRLLSFDGTDLQGNGGYLGGTNSLVSGGGDIGDMTSGFTNIAVGDIDGDGFLDFVGAGNASAYIYFDESPPYVSGFVGSVIIDENTPAGASLGTLSFSDIQGDVVTRSIQGTNASLFNFNASTGEISTASVFDWETLGSDLSFDLVISDASKTVIEKANIRLNNLPEQGERTFSEDGEPLFGAQETRLFKDGDYDMDGDADLFKVSDVRGGGPREVVRLLDSQYPNSVFEQFDGAFVEKPLYGVTNNFNSFEFLDVDNDGDLDVIGGEGLFVVQVTNDGNSFEPGTSSVTYLGGGADLIIVGDFDGDGADEIAVQHFDNSGIYSRNEVEVLELDDTGDFVTNQTLAMNVLDPPTSGIIDDVGNMQSIVISDFTGDGADDLMVFASTGGETPDIRGLLFQGGVDIGDGIIGFSSSYTTAISFDNSSLADNNDDKALKIGDIDGDGLDDIVFGRAASGSYASSVEVFLSDGDGTFTQGASIDLGNAGGYMSFDIGDIDGDGSNDIITSAINDLSLLEIGGYSLDLDIHANDGAGSFTSIQSFEVNGLELKLMDVDSDDDLDIVLNQVIFESPGEDQAGDVFNENGLVVYRNENIAPSALALSATSFNEEIAIDSEIATISVTDANPDDTHVISLVTGDGTNDSGNSFFSVNGDRLVLSKFVDFETTPTLNIYLSANDGNGNTYEQAFTLTVNDVEEPLGLEDELNNALGIYPNPGIDRIQLNINNDVTGAVEVRVLDLNGKVLRLMTDEKSGSEWSASINMTDMKSGIYIVEMNIVDWSASQRWIKE